MSSTAAFLASFASILIGACRDHTFTGSLAGAQPASSEDFARELVRTAVFGLLPTTPTPEEEAS